MSNVTTINPAARRREAGVFLRSRRERLTPAEAGFPNGFDLNLYWNNSGNFPI